MSSDIAIGDFGLISDCQTCALVRRDGSIDWYCPDRFDAPSAFARILDPNGGHWSIRPTAPFEVTRAYLDDTMVLRTEFSTHHGRIALTDALALGPGSRGHDIGKQVPHTILRRVEGLEGNVEIAMEFVPRLEYALTTPLLRRTDTGIVASGGPTDLHFSTTCSDLDISDSDITGMCVVHAGEVVDFSLAYRRAAGTFDTPVTTLDVGAGLADTIAGWTSWAEHHRTYAGPYVEHVRRSALVLQALTYGPTGAVIAAATTSLPELQGGANNWDYRFVWLRDLSLTMRALWIAACPDEAGVLLHWMARANAGQWLKQHPVQIMYGVEGERDLTERVLEHLEGFGGARPVRAGNAAWRQKQLDVLGEIVDAVYLFRDRPGAIDDVIARLVGELADQAARSWHEPDAGMWEARDKERHYLSSKVMCWVALDRAIRMAPQLGDHARVDAWDAARQDVRTAILEQGWCEEIGAYTGAFGSDHLDASVLLMPLVDFLPATDERMRATIEIIARDLVEGGLVHRWAGDDNGFLICTYWLVECLARAGEVQRAITLFEETTAYANDLGLLAEEADPATGRLWGNFPQAFSHVGLINAAAAIADATQITPGS